MHSYFALTGLLHAAVTEPLTGPPTLSAGRLGLSWSSAEVGIALFLLRVGACLLLGCVLSTRRGQWELLQTPPNGLLLPSLYSRPSRGQIGPALLGPEVLLLLRVLFSLHYWVTAGRALFPGLLRKVLAVCKSLPAASLLSFY